MSTVGSDDDFNFASELSAQMDEMTALLGLTGTDAANALGDETAAPEFISIRSVYSAGGYGALEAAVSSIMAEE